MCLDRASETIASLPEMSLFFLLFVPGDGVAGGGLTTPAFTPAPLKKSFRAASYTVT